MCVLYSKCRQQIVISCIFSEVFLSLRANHIADQSQVEIAHLESIEAEVQMRKAELNLKLRQVRSFQNLQQFEGK